MNGRFLIFGVIVSVILHAALLFVLALSSGNEAPASADAPSQEVSDPSPATTDDSDVSGQPSVSGKSPSESVCAAQEPPRRVVLPNARSTPVREPAPTPEAEWVTYTVKKGDMLDRLVKKAGCSVSEAARYNKTTVKKLSALKVGQRIKLPKFAEP